MDKFLARVAEALAGVAETAREATKAETEALAREAEAAGETAETETLAGEAEAEAGADKYLAVVAPFIPFVDFGVIPDGSSHGIRSFRGDSAT
jgi:hypothetical protein